MLKTRKAYNSYDHKIKEAIAASGDPYMFPGVSIPKSTAKTWINKGISGFITHPIFSYSKSSSRYYSWLKLEKGCELEDYSSCPRSNPDRLTGQEISIMKEMVLNPDYSHLTCAGTFIFCKKNKKSVCKCQHLGKLHKRIWLEKTGKSISAKT